MTKIYEITGKISANKLMAIDAVGRGKVLVSQIAYKVGDFVLVTNEVIIGKTNKQNDKTYVV